MRSQIKSANDEGGLKTAVSDIFGKNRVHLNEVEHMILPNTSCSRHRTASELNSERAIHLAEKSFSELLFGKRLKANSLGLSRLESQA